MTKGEVEEKKHYAADGKKRTALCASRRRHSGEENGSEDDHKKNIYIAKSYRISIINWWHITLHYIHYITMSVMVAIAAIAINEALKSGVGWREIVSFSIGAKDHALRHWYIYLPLAFVLLYYLLRGAKQPVYLIDFALFEPPQSWRVTKDQIMKILRVYDCQSEENFDFMRRILDRSGTGENTAWPPGSVRVLDGQSKPDFSLRASREECETVVFNTMDNLLERTGINPRSIDFLIVNCSLFAPTPSIAGMVENKYNLRQDVKSYNLSGMGCSAGVISIDLARDLLNSKPNSTAVVISTEVITPNMYQGNERSMLVQNTLFRCGGAAMLLSNKPTDAFRAKYKLLNTVRTQRSDQESHECVYQREDSDGNVGVSLSKNITQIAGKALTENLTMMGPHVLPLREQIQAVWAIIMRRTCNYLKKILQAQSSPALQNAAEKLPQFKHYVPDFKKGIQHFCIHAGGRAVIDGVEQNLKLEPYHTAPSREALYNYGNTSSSSIWYELKYIEQEDEKWTPKEAGPKIRKGDRVLQIAFGSGFKCNSAVWVRMR
eukprot:gb/GECG01006939.1/.p1 GENE.gb/GECG01006939.1/~~gb/GECG01006939.1/.p1  ORF type:complete len:548 (+),score=50.69 gb/GECG01006939.1/:1-1644(+)